MSDTNSDDIDDEGREAASNPSPDPDSPRNGAQDAPRETLSEAIARRNAEDEERWRLAREARERRQEERLDFWRALQAKDLDAHLRGKWLRAKEKARMEMLIADAEEGTLHYDKVEEIEEKHREAANHQSGE